MLNCEMFYELQKNPNLVEMQIKNISKWTNPVEWFLNSLLRPCMLSCISCSVLSLKYSKWRKYFGALA